MTPEEARAEADRLTLEQREARGWHRAKDLDGKSALIPNPYVPTAENEARAKRIVELRRASAK